MKKNILKGFSLAELLITIAIISIITTMGINISQKGIEKAYNYYIYNGYNSLSLAIADAYSHNYSPCTKEFSEHIVKVLNGISEGDPDADENTIFKTPNNIKYKLATTNNKKILITMYTPKAIDSDGTEHNIIKLLLDPKNTHYGLIPATKHSNLNSNTQYLLIFKRHDLLPFTIDDGESGKIVQLYNNGVLENPSLLSHNKRVIYSYYDAFCNLYGDVKYNETINELVSFNYSSCTKSEPTEKGVLKSLNPKKVF